MRADNMIWLLVAAAAVIGLVIWWIVY